MVNFIIPTESAKIKPKKNSTNMSGKPFNNIFENFVRLKGVHLIELMVISTFNCALSLGSKNKKKGAHPAIHKYCSNQQQSEPPYFLS